MLRTAARVSAAIALFVAFAISGLLFASHLVPHQLRGLIERELSAALLSPVSIERVRVRLGRGIILQGENATTWLEPPRLAAQPHEAVDGTGRVSASEDEQDSRVLDPLGPSQGLVAPGLYAGRIDASLDLIALLTGRFRVSRITLVDTVLRVTRDADGEIRPAPIATLLEPRSRGPAAEPLSGAEELLLPLSGIRAAVEFLLTKPFVAQVWELRNCTISLHDAYVDGSGTGASGRVSHVLSLNHLSGSLLHGRNRRGTRVSVRGRLFDANERESGVLEWVGTRDEKGAIRTTFATTGLDLATLLPYARAGNPNASLEGALTGAVVHETVWSDRSRLDVDFVVRDLKTSLVSMKASKLGDLESDRADARFVLDITPENVQVLRAQIASGPLDLKAKGTVDRPLDESSVADLSISFHDVALAPLFERAGWLPEPEEGRQGRDPIRAGRINTLTARGAAPVSVWLDFFAGQTPRLPSGFAVDGEVVDAELRVGDSDRLEDVDGHVTWSGDQLRVTGATGDLNGSPLPTMDLTVDGVSHLLATQSAQRMLRSGGQPLLGLGTFWGLFQSEEPRSSEMSTTLWLQIDTLEHPMFLWPIADLWATIEPTLGGVHIVTTKGTWAGARIYGDADWIFEPEERLSMRLTAQPADADASYDAGRGAEAGIEPEHRTWASGRFTVGALDGESWQHESASGTFTAHEALLQFGDVEIMLEPTGRLIGSGSVDLGQHDSVAADLAFQLSDGDLGKVGLWLGLPEGAAVGQLDLSGRLRGALRPEAPLFSDVEGQITVVARAGTLKRGIPPIVSVALSSKAATNPFAKRERVRFDRVDTTFDFDAGVIRTDSFVLDGPDLRLFASGNVDIVRPPHEMDVEVAVFLFRQIDRAIGKIPLLNRLLLGDDESFQAAYYRLTGPWEDPGVKFYPMRTLASGPANLVLERVPRLLKRGLDAIGAALRGDGEKTGKTPRRRKHKNPARKRS